MSKNFMIAMGAGVVCIAILVAAILVKQRGAHIAVSGQVIKVRTAPLDENSTIVVLDFRVTNSSDYPFVARNVTAIFEDAAGNRTDGTTASEIDAQHIFQGVPVLGEKYNQSMIERDQVNPRGTLTRMVMARFDMPEAKLQGRKRFVIQIEEIDGQLFEIAEK